MLQGIRRIRQEFHDNAITAEAAIEAMGQEGWDGRSARKFLGLATPRSDNPLRDAVIVVLGDGVTQEDVLRVLREHDIPEPRHGRLRRVAARAAVADEA